MVTAMLGAMLLFFGRQENIPALKWWGTAYLLGSASVALWTIAGTKLGEPLSLALNAVGFLACGMVWNASRVFHGRKAELARAGAGRDRLARRHDDAAAGEAALRLTIGAGHRRGLCGADRRRIVVRAPPVHATALAGDRGAGHCTVSC